MLGSLGADELSRQEGDRRPSLGRRARALQGVVFVDRRRRSASPRSTLHGGGDGRGDAGGAVRRGDDRRRQSPLALPLVAFRGGPAGRAARTPAQPSIQPVYLDYSRLAGLPMARADRPRIAWYGDMTFLRHFLQLRPRRRRDLRRLLRPADSRFGRTWTERPPPGSTEAAVRRPSARRARLRLPAIFPAREKAYIGFGPETLIVRIESRLTVARSRRDSRARSPAGVHQVLRLPDERL